MQSRIFFFMSKQRETEKQWCLHKITNYYFYFIFFTVSQYIYTELSTQTDLHYITLLPLKQTLMCPVFGLDDCCSALFNLFDGDQPCSCVWSERKILTKGLWRQSWSWSHLMVHSARIASQQIYACPNQIKWVVSGWTDRHYILIYRHLL